MVREFAERLKKVDELQDLVAASSGRVDEPNNSVAESSVCMDKLTRSIDHLVQQQMKAESQLNDSASSSSERFNKLTQSAENLAQQQAMIQAAMLDLMKIKIGDDQQGGKNLVPIFRGGDPRFWMTFMDIRFLRDDFLESQKLNFDACFIDGEARLWFQWRQSLWLFSNWEDLKANLLLRYGNKNDPERMRLMTESCRFLHKMINKHEEDKELEAVDANESIQVNSSPMEPGLTISATNLQGFASMMANRENVMRKMDIHVCNGKNPHGWIAQEERYFRINLFLEDKKLTLVSLSLEGDALKWYNEELTREVFTDWREFKTRLLARFSTIKNRSPTEVIPESKLFSEDKFLHDSELVQWQELFEQKDLITLSQFQETSSMSELSKEEIDVVQNTSDKKIIGERKSAIVSQFQETTPVSDSEVHHELVPLPRERETSRIKDMMRPHMSVLNFKFIDVGSEVKVFKEVLDIQQSSFAYLLGDNMLHSGQMIQHHFRKQKCSKSWHFKFKNRFQTRNRVQEQLWFHGSIKYFVDKEELIHNKLLSNETIDDAVDKHDIGVKQAFPEILRQHVYLIDRKNCWYTCLYSVVYEALMKTIILEEIKESWLIEEAQSCYFVDEIIKVFRFWLQTGDKLQQLITDGQQVSVHMAMASPKYEEVLSKDVEWEIAWKDEDLEVTTGVNKSAGGISKEIRHEISGRGNNESSSYFLNAHVRLLKKGKSFKRLTTMKQTQMSKLRFKTWMQQFLQDLKRFIVSEVKPPMRNKDRVTHLFSVPELMFDNSLSTILCSHDFDRESAATTVLHGNSFWEDYTMVTKWRANVGDDLIGYGAVFIQLMLDSFWRHILFSRLDTMMLCLN